MNQYQYRLLACVCVLLMCAVIVLGRDLSGSSGGLMSRNPQDEDVLDIFNKAANNGANQ